MSACVGRCLDGCLLIQKPEIIQDLISDSEKHIIKTVPETLKNDSRERNCLIQASCNKDGRYRRRWRDRDFVSNETTGSLWLDPKWVQYIQRKSEPDCKAALDLCDALSYHDEIYRKDLEDMKIDRQIHELRRQEMLHKKWTEEVYEPIQRQLEYCISGSTMDRMRCRKQKLYIEYLELINKKGHVFLEDEDPGEYFGNGLNPSNSSTLKVEVGRLKDPLLSEGRRRTAEDSIVLRCATGCVLKEKDIEQIRLPPLPLVPLGRHGTCCSTWSEMPMGQIDSNVRLASRRRIRSDHNHSKINFKETQLNNEYNTDQPCHFDSTRGNVRNDRPSTAPPIFQLTNDPNIYSYCVKSNATQVNM